MPALMHFSRGAGPRALRAGCALTLLCLGAVLSCPVGAADRAASRSPNPSSDTVGGQASPRAMQNGQLEILTQEKNKTLLELDVLGKAPKSAEVDERMRRAREDLRAIDSEIARVQKTPPPVIRNTDGRTAPLVPAPATRLAQKEKDQEPVAPARSPNSLDIFERTEQISSR